MGNKKEGKDQEADDQDREDQDDGPETDDSGEDEDSSEDEGEEGDEEEEEASDSSEEQDKPKTPNFFDPKKLDPTLKPVWNLMQASFTRAMQKARLSGRKAAAFDELMKRPDFQEYIQKLRGASRNGDDREERNGRRSGGRDQDSVRSLIREELSAALKPIQEERVEAKKAQTRKEFNRFKKENPDWVVYQDRMDEILEDNPNLTYRQALRLAKDEDEGSEEDNRDLLRKKKKANVGKSGGSSADKGKQPKEINTIFDAFEESKAELKRK